MNKYAIQIFLIDGRRRRIGKQVDGVLTQGFLYQDELFPETRHSSARLTIKNGFDNPPMSAVKRGGACDQQGCERRSNPAHTNSRARPFWYQCYVSISMSL